MEELPVQQRILMNCCRPLLQKNHRPKLAFQSNDVSPWKMKTDIQINRGRPVISRP